MVIFLVRGLIMVLFEPLYPLFWGLFNKNIEHKAERDG